MSRTVDNMTSTTNLHATPQESIKKEESDDSFYSEGETERRLRDLGVEFSVSVPPWSAITRRVGPEAIVIGMEDQCSAYQRRVPPHMRILAPAGLFNSGTNLLAYLLRANCRIGDQMYAESPWHQQGVSWQVPWGKHNPATTRTRYTIPKSIYQEVSEEAILAVVTVRHPLDWMRSMCRRRYSAQWDRSVCPHLLDAKSGETVPVNVGYGAVNVTARYETLLHLWNEWNLEYWTSSQRLLLRMEDLVLFPKKLVKQVCDCAGGKMAENFTAIHSDAKDGVSGHGRGSRTTLVDAWIRLGTTPLWEGFNEFDKAATSLYLDKELFRLFNYRLDED